MSVAARLVRLLRTAAWAPFGVVFLHHGLAAVFGHRVELDPFFHVLGGAAMAYFVATAVTVAEPLLGRLTPVGAAVLAVTGAVTIAVCWEFAEFVGDYRRGTHVQASIGETLADLALGLAGALVFAAVRLAVVRSRASGDRSS